MEMIEWILYYVCCKQKTSDERRISDWSSDVCSADLDEWERGRRAKAADEMSHWAEYDDIIINDNRESSVAQVEAILTAERLRRERRVGLRTFVEVLRAGQ